MHSASPVMMDIGLNRPCGFPEASRSALPMAGLFVSRQRVDLGSMFMVVSFLELIGFLMESDTGWISPLGRTT